MIDVFNRQKLIDHYINLYFVGCWLQNDFLSVFQVIHSTHMELLAQINPYFRAFHQISSKVYT